MATCIMWGNAAKGKVYLIRDQSDSAFTTVKNDPIMKTTKSAFSKMVRLWNANHTF
jgi:hypothetical protein